ncbi:hypothetical protein E1B28_009195 [Marasmius oreades]|uniref:protein-serine/threonine phosphatase n=1 Tax=Marasmius oreades TaxID=181124 RepID=A0A9P7UT54_9AGAR|nr:uncharacterized protein E1B28_009195 [Marasmius oreades]KAG7092885.1 hypothetical protein E1B28_009195 [Marasmius oreades]
MVDIEFRPSTSQAQAVDSDGNAVIATEASIPRSTSQLDASGSEERWVTLQFVWSGKQFSLDVADSDRVLDLKTAIQDLTRVPPERQKILGLVKGKLPADQGRISDLNLINGKRFSLIGTPDGDEIKDPSQPPDVVNDLDFDPTQDSATVAAYKNDQRNIRKVKEATDKLNLNIIHPLREGKRLLVLDLDYTILDTKPLTSGSLPPAECARPGLHEFLEAVYPHYDICIWSQTSWVWLETKLVELEMIGSNRNYHISFVLDKTSMFTVFSDRDGKPLQHHVKPLQIIWNHLPQFDASNTIHIDDLSRNFALNPQSGLKIQAFKNAHTPQSLADRELSKLSRYLVYIAGITDFKGLSHKAWKDIEKGLPPSRTSFLGFGIDITTRRYTSCTYTTRFSHCQSTPEFLIGVPTQPLSTCTVKLHPPVRTSTTRDLASTLNLVLFASSYFNRPLYNHATQEFEFSAFLEAYSRPPNHLFKLKSKETSDQEHREEYRLRHLVKEHHILSTSLHVNDIEPRGLTLTSSMNTSELLATGLGCVKVLRISFPEYKDMFLHAIVFDLPALSRYLSFQLLGTFEVLLWNQLSHPNIPPFRGVNTETILGGCLVIPKSGKK